MRDPHLCIFNIIQVILVWFCVKETKGLALEEIDYVSAKPTYRARRQAQLYSIEHSTEQDINVDKKDDMKVQMENPSQRT